MKAQTVKKLQDALREVRESYHRHVCEVLRDSTKSYAVIGQMFGMSEGTVYQIARMNGLCRTNRKEENHGE